jgi:Domain of unknown function (DUF202)
VSAHDPGLQPERTALAWQRTGFIAALLAVLLLRSGINGKAPLEVAAAVSAAGVAVVCVVSPRRLRTPASTRYRLALAAGGAVLSGLLTAGHLAALLHGR